MALRRLLNLVLAFCVTLGLAMGPVVTPAAAMKSSLAMDDMSAMSADEMSADMPCCPSEPTSKGCPDCPSMALCGMKTVQAGPSLVPVTMVRQAIRTSHAYMDDALTDGVDRPPPDHPPRA